MTYTTDTERDQLICQLQDELDELRWELYSGAYAGSSEQTLINVNHRIGEIEDSLADMMNE
jgi:hypothetical protein